MKQCGVRGCSNVWGKGDVKRNFYSFPTNEEKRKLWVANMPQAQVEGWTPTKNSVICQDHFVGGFRWNVPTIFPPLPSKPPRKRPQKNTSAENPKAQKMCIGESAHLPTTSSTKPVESVLVIPDGATIKIARPQTVSSHPKKRPASSLPTGGNNNLNITVGRGPQSGTSNCGGQAEYVIKTNEGRTQTRFIIKTKTGPASRGSDSFMKKLEYRSKKKDLSFPMSESTIEVEKLKPVSTNVDTIESNDQRAIPLPTVLCQDVPPPGTTLKHPIIKEEERGLNIEIGDPKCEQKVDNKIQCSVCEEKYDNITEYTHHLNMHLQQADNGKIKTEFDLTENRKQHVDEGLELLKGEMKEIERKDILQEGFTHAPDALKGDYNLCDPNELKDDSNICAPVLKSDSNTYASTQFKSDSKFSVCDELKSDTKVHAPDELKTDQNQYSPDELKSDSILCALDGLKTDPSSYAPDDMKSDTNLCAPDEFKTDLVHTNQAEVVHNPPKPFSCTLCDKSFCTKGVLSMHVDVVHYKLKKFQCTSCEKSFGCKPDLNRHFAAVHSKLRKFSCAVCNASFTQKPHLTRHTEAIHDKLKSFTCTLCDKSFALKAKLSRHIDTVHCQLKHFSCTFCNKSFSQKSNMTKHINAVHHKMKSFSCTLCDKSFTRNEHLAVHMDSVHYKLKPFNCMLCDKSFLQKGDLSRHNDNIHRKLKPFSCTLCEKSFSQKVHLNSHIDKVHNKQMYH